VIVAQGVCHDGLAVDGQGRFDELAERRRLDSDGSRTFASVGLADPTPSELDDVRDAFGIHPLAIEDAAGNEERIFSAATVKDPTEEIYRLRRWCWSCPGWWRLPSKSSPRSAMRTNRSSATSSATSSPTPTTTCNR